MFGFHFARLDIREHAGVHRRALAEIYRALRVCDDYEGLPEEERVALLQAQIADRRPLIPTDIDRFSEPTRETIETFRMLRTTLDGRATAGRSRPTSSPAARDRPTCSRCFC